MEMHAEPTERGWEMVSILRRHCRFPRELEMEVYAGIVGKEAAIAFLRWQASEQDRPLTAGDILERWPETATSWNRAVPGRPAAAGKPPAPAR